MDGLDLAAQAERSGLGCLDLTIQTERSGLGWPGFGNPGLADGPFRDLTSKQDSGTLKAHRGDHNIQSGIVCISLSMNKGGT